MKRIVVCAIALFLATGAANLTAAERTVQTKSHFEFTPQIQYGFGKTEYILELRAVDSLNRVYYVKSQLEFPLDAFLVGAKLRYVFAPETVLPWYFEAGVQTNLTDPKGIMRDRDWSNWWNNLYLYDPREVSNTESDAKMRSININTEVGKVLVQGERSDLRVFAAFRYQWIDQEIVGLKGYQLDTNGDSLFHFDFPGLRGIDYTISYYVPYAGLGVSTILGDKVTIGGHAAYAIVKAENRDDHLLRHKLSTASTTGGGFVGGGELTWAMSRGRSNPIYLTLTGEFSYYSSNGTQTQYYYGDDPGTPEDETGIIFGGIPHTVHALQGRIGLQLAIRL